MYRPVAAPAGRGIENRSFTERAQVSPPVGDFALASGFVGLIFLVFPASLGLSTGSKVTLPCSGLEQPIRKVVSTCGTSRYERWCTDGAPVFFEFFILIDVATPMLRDDCGSSACRCCGRVSPHA